MNRTFQYCLAILSVVGIVGCRTTLSDHEEQSLSALATLIEQQQTVVADMQEQEYLAEGNTQDAAHLTKRALAVCQEPDTPQWKLPFNEQTVNRVLLGRSHAFLFFDVSRRKRLESSLVKWHETPELRDWDMGYDFNRAISCIDMRTGKVLWTRYTPGRTKAVLDNETDTLYLWRKKLFALDCRTGDLTLDLQLPPRGEYLDGIVVGGKVLIPEETVREVSRKRCYPRVYDCDREAEREVDVLASRMTCPDGSKRIYPPFSVREVSDMPPTLGQAPELWSFSQSSTANLPWWWDNNAVMHITGGIYDKGTVFCLDARTGKPLWTFVLPRGGAQAKMNQLRGGAYPADQYNAANRFGEHLLAIGGSGGMFFLDPKSGACRMHSSLVSRHLAFPVLVQESIVLASHTHIRAVPLDDIFMAEVSPIRKIGLRQARNLQAMGKISEAIETALAVTDRFPDHAEGWACLADLYRASEAQTHEIASRCRFLALTGEHHDKRLTETWGLVARLPIEEDLLASPTVYEGKVYCGTQAGRVWEIDPDTLAFEMAREYPAAVKRLSTRHQLLANDSVMMECDPMVPETAMSDRDLQAFVEIVKGKGMGDGSLIMSCADKRFAVLVRAKRSTADVEIWDRIGQTLLRTETIQTPGYVRNRPRQLQILRDGCLIAGNELLWIPNDPARPAWRFSLKPAPPRSVPLIHFQHGTHFSAPAIINDKIFVSHRGGGVYVFSVDTITGSSDL